MNAVEAFIQDKVLPEHRPTVEAFRALVAKDFPELNEEMRGGTEAYYGIPVYRLTHIVAGISPTKTGVTFSFNEGKSFEDKYGLLEGAGNKTRNIRLKTPEAFDAEVMRYYLHQAVTLDRHA